MLRVRPRHLPGLHGLRARRDPLSRPRGSGAGRRTRDHGRPPGRLRGRRGARHEDADRAQRPRLLPQPRAGLDPQPGLGLALREGRPLHRLAVHQRARGRRVVASDHFGVPARQPHPPRAEHARALDRRRPRGAGDRAGAVPRALHRFRARRLGGCAALRARMPSRSARRAPSTGFSALHSCSRRKGATFSGAKRSG